MPKVSYRMAEEKDAAIIVHFIRAIAEYEKLLDQVEATEESIREWVFRRKQAEVLFVCEDEREVGFALFFHNFSTFTGRSGLYLEDLFVEPECRGRGYGKGLLQRLAKIAVDRGYARMEWVCLDWNRPSIDFYRSLGAIPMDGWTIYRLQGETLLKNGREPFSDGE